MQRGFFISFEGSEGSGKSTQIRELEKRLDTAGREVIVTREPGGTAVGEEIRRLLQFTPEAGMTVADARKRRRETEIALAQTTSRVPPLPPSDVNHPLVQRVERLRARVKAKNGGELPPDYKFEDEGGILKRTLGHFRDIAESGITYTYQHWGAARTRKGGFRGDLGKRVDWKKVNALRAKNRE